MVPLAQENAVGPQAGPREARVLDQDAMQAHDFVERQRVLPGLQHRAAPPLQPVARRPFAFDLEAGAAVGQQKEAGRARDHVRAGASNDLVRLGSERARAEVRERLRPANDRAEGRRAEQVVAHLVTTGQPRRRREIKAVVEQIGETRLRRIGNVERPAGEEFIEEPGAPVGCAGRGAAHECGDGILRDGFEEPFQDEQVEVFMAQRESQLVAEGLAGPVSLVEDVPAPLLPAARLDVLSGYDARSADGGLNSECSGRGPPSPPALYPPAPSSPERFWRDHYCWVDFQRPRSKTPLFGRKKPIISFLGRKLIYTTLGRKPIFSVENELDFALRSKITIPRWLQVWPLPSSLAAWEQISESFPMQ